MGFWKWNLGIWQRNLGFWKWNLGNMGFWKRNLGNMGFRKWDLGYLGFWKWNMGIWQWNFGYLGDRLRRHLEDQKMHKEEKQRKMRKAWTPEKLHENLWPMLKPHVTMV